MVMSKLNHMEGMVNNQRSIFSKILVPLDGSQLAEQVLPSVVSLAQRMRAAVMLLRVSGHPARQYFVEGLAVNVSQSDDSHLHCEAYLCRIAESITGNNDLMVNYAVREGPIADVILDYADEIDADLITMSTHGRTGVGRWLMGSVADRVLHSATVPVLLIRSTMTSMVAEVQSSAATVATAVAPVETGTEKTK